jgi:NAD+ kinase
MIHFDGQVRRDARSGDRLVVRRSPETIAFLHPPAYSYFSMLREKLHWSAIPKRG